MIPLIKLKRDVQFNGEFTKVVDVMKGIAAARFHVLQRQLTSFEPYYRVIEAFLREVNVYEVSHPFVQPQVTTVGVLMVTSDAGFLGGLNQQVVATGLREGGPDGLLTVVGERGANLVRDARRECAGVPGIQDATRRQLALAVRDHLVQQVLSRACGKLLVVYPKPISFAVQEVTVETFIPCTAWISQRERVPGRPILWESAPVDVVEYVAIQWMGHRLEEIFALSRLAELAARAMHLEGSYQELLRLGKRLKQQYFRARHEVIDRSMREVYASQLFCGKSESVEPDTDKSNSVSGTFGARHVYEEDSDDR